MCYLSDLWEFEFVKNCPNDGIFSGQVFGWNGQFLSIVEYTHVEDMTKWNNANVLPVRKYSAWLKGKVKIIKYVKVSETSYARENACTADKQLAILLTGPLKCGFIFAN